MVRAERRHRWCGNVFDLLSHPASEHLYKNASPGLQCLRCGPAMAEQNRKYIKTVVRVTAKFDPRVICMSLPRQMDTGCHPVDRRTCVLFLGADEKRNE